METAFQNYNIVDILLNSRHKLKKLSDISWQLSETSGGQCHLKLIIIISGPSGAGKDSIVNLLNQDKFEKVKTATTRKPRPGESKDAYFWLSESKFLKLLKEGEFVEYAQYDGCYYGTWRKKIEEILDKNKIPVFIINPEGARSFLTLQKNGEKLFKNRKIIYFYITPPTTRELRDRLLSRALLLGYSKKEAEEKACQRLKVSYQDLTHIFDAEFIVINNEGKLQETTNEIEKAIQKCG